MGKRYVAKTYNNRRLLRWALWTAVSIALAAVVMFVLLFFWLQIYQVPNIDESGIRLEIPWLMDDAALTD